MFLLIYVTFFSSVFILVKLKTSHQANGHHLIFSTSCQISQTYPETAQFSWQTNICRCRLEECCTEHVYLDVPVGEQQVDDDVDREALHVVQPLLDAAQLSSQLHASVQLPSFTDLVQNRLAKILAARQETRKAVWA